MYGLLGYIQNKKAYPISINRLSKLEYQLRRYHSLNSLARYINSIIHISRRDLLTPLFLSTCTSIFDCFNQKRFLHISHISTIKHLFHFFLLIFYSQFILIFFYAWSVVSTIGLFFCDVTNKVEGELGVLMGNYEETVDVATNYYVNYIR